jgi:hypothetical protein
VWYWYCVDFRCTRSAVLTKLLQAWDVLRGRVPRSSVWALSSTVSGSDLQQTRARMRSFAQSLPVSISADVQSQRAARAGGGAP